MRIRRSGPSWNARRPPSSAAWDAPLNSRDRTGRPGPSTWELGAYPEGRGDYPGERRELVRGRRVLRLDAQGRSQRVSLAQGIWRGVFHGSCDARQFQRPGSREVGKLKDLGPHGTYGMAGNVKEWVWNEHRGQRYILGGGWNEPVYQATNNDARPPLDRAETNGFRCAKEAEPSDASAFAPWGAPVPVRDASRLKPVSDSEFAAFRRFYAYDRTPLDGKLERTDDEEHWRRERVSFAAAYGGERVLANILIPKNVRPPYQAVVWFPGSYALQLKSTARDLPFSVYFDFVARSGRALVYPVYSGTYERRRPAPAVTGRTRLRRSTRSETRSSDGRKTSVARWTIWNLAATSTAAGLRITDTAWVPGRHCRSSGSSPASPPRFCSLAVLPRRPAPGDRSRQLPAASGAAGSHDGRKVRLHFPSGDVAETVVQSFGTPARHKRLVTFENAGHVPPRIELIREVLDWLDRYLGPVER